MPVSSHPFYATQEGYRALLLDTPELLVSGGDSRLRIDRTTGVSRYGCSAYPQPDIFPLGSCTASTISRLGFHVAWKSQEWLRDVGPGQANESALEATYRRIRLELRSILIKHQVPGVEAVITPSGTDAEIVALALIAGDGARPICNIVVGPSEIGGGSLLAASGLYFDPGVPNQSIAFGQRQPGTAVDGRLRDLTSTIPIEIRESDGSLRSSAAVDSEVKDVVLSRLHRGCHVIVHRVAHSKTGIFAPSDALLISLQRQYSQHLSIVADCAQGRVSRQQMINSLRCGHLIIVTGSKFYGGPPFSGALLVPQNLHPSQTGLHRFPSRFSDFLTAACLPDDWQGLRNSLPVAGNPGLAIRWLAALAEMRRYFAIPERTRLDIVTAFQRLVVSRLSTARSLQLRFVEPPPIHRTAAEHLENLMTVFPFSFHFPERIRDSIDGDTMEYLFHSLHQPLPAAGKYSREDDSNPCRARFHVGRPVKMGFQTPSANDALRIAIGAPLISEVSECHGSVSSYDQKLEWIDNKLSLFIQKLEYQAAHLDLRERQNLQTVAIRRAA